LLLYYEISIVLIALGIVIGAVKNGRRVSTIEEGQGQKFEAELDLADQGQP
jgi:hypothetical protein